MKNNSRGWPSSERRNNGFAKDVNSWTNRADAVTVSLEKCGAAFDRAMMSAG